MSQVLETITAKKESRKIGKYHLDHAHKIQPSTRQYSTAMSVASVLNPWTKQKDIRGGVVTRIPVFYAPDLEMRTTLGEEVEIDMNCNILRIVSICLHFYCIA